MASAEPIKHEGPADYGTRERWLKGDVVTVGLESERLQIAKATLECRLDWYERRALISERQHEAGMRARHLFRRAIFPPSCTSSYAQVSGRGGNTPDMEESRQRLRNALIGASLAVSDGRRSQFRILMIKGEQRFPDFLPLRLKGIGHVVMAVCGLDEWAGGSQRLMQLREGLGNLADYWQLEG